MVNLILTGPYAGRDIVLRGYVFRGGRLTLRADWETVEGIVRYLGRCYQAYVEGSPQHQEAQERDRRHAEDYVIRCGIVGTEPQKSRSGHPDPYCRHAQELRRRISQEQVNGEREVLRKAQQGQTGAPRGDLQPTGGGAPESGAHVERRDDVGGGGDSRIPADGPQRSSAEAPRQGPPEVPSATAQPDQRLTDAILALDPDNDDHWTREGLPVVAVIASLSSSNPSRSDVEAAAPGYTREAARERMSVSRS